MTKLYDLDISYENISINYYQPEFYNEAITIRYSEEKHNKIEKQLYEYVNKIKNTNFDYEKNLKNINHCKFCEFNKLCNNKEINFSILEDEIYES
ncbi:PD-(D/E)XK nuclease superfamily protein [[Clostridium] sordellii ATCC 9714]|nr:PD-(D/E)XK nuclease superfamily protein [[Clostridium] sordellii ATCC 9714] [Paeniclostridium sordellii ATCC 9714]